MKTLAMAIGLAFLGVGGAVGIGAAKHEQRIAPNTYVGMVEVGGLKPEDAARKIRLWWQSERIKTIVFVLPKSNDTLAKYSFTELGANVDDDGSIKGLPMSDFWEEAKEKIVHTDAPAQKFDLKLQFGPSSAVKSLQAMVTKKIGVPHPARIEFKGGNIVRVPETGTVQLSEQKLSDNIQSAVRNSLDKIEVPIEEAPKRIPDAELEKVTAVIGSYTTKFPAHQTSRNTNIRLAAAKLNGKLLMPHERLSFNGTVGRRTLKAGFKEAPVIINGQHDTGVGGGICQVSTTLYNASVLADLKIVSRHNHTFPSVYVPVGRDATVDWGSLDLVLENDSDSPIAIASESTNSTVTFRVLGKPVPGREVKIETASHKSWANGVKTIHDSSLRPGTTRVKEKGGSGHSITTYRVVMQDGKVVKREQLNNSYYKGSPRIIAVGPSVKKSTPAVSHATTSSAPTTPVTTPATSGVPR